MRRALHTYTEQNGHSRSNNLAAVHPVITTRTERQFSLEWLTITRARISKRFKDVMRESFTMCTSQLLFRFKGMGRYFERYIHQFLQSVWWEHRDDALTCEIDMKLRSLALTLAWLCLKVWKSTYQHLWSSLTNMKGCIDYFRLFHGWYRLTGPKYQCSQPRSGPAECFPHVYAEEDYKTPKINPFREPQYFAVHTIRVSGGWELSERDTSKGRDSLPAWRRITWEGKWILASFSILWPFNGFLNFIWH